MAIFWMSFSLGVRVHRQPHRPEGRNGFEKILDEEMPALERRKVISGCSDSRTEVISDTEKAEAKIIKMVRVMISFGMVRL